MPGYSGILFGDMWVTNKGGTMTAVAQIIGMLVVRTVVAAVIGEVTVKLMGRVTHWYERRYHDTSRIN